MYSKQISSGGKRKDPEGVHGYLRLIWTVIWLDDGCVDRRVTCEADLLNLAGTNDSRPCLRSDGRACEMIRDHYMVTADPKATIGCREESGRHANEISEACKSHE